MSYPIPVSTTPGKRILILQIQSLSFGKALTILCFEVPISESRQTSRFINTIFLQRRTSDYSLSIIHFSLRPSPSHHHLSPGSWNGLLTGLCFHWCPHCICSYIAVKRWCYYSAQNLPMAYSFTLKKVKLLTKTLCMMTWPALPLLNLHTLTIPQICEEALSHLRASVHRAWHILPRHSVASSLTLPGSVLHCRLFWEVFLDLI